MKIEELRKLSIDEIFTVLNIVDINVRTDEDGNIDYINYTLKPNKVLVLE